MTDSWDVWIHETSDEAARTAPIARELVRSRLAGQGDLMNGELLDFTALRDDESIEERSVRQAVLAGCLARIAAEALRTLYTDHGVLNHDAVALFLAELARLGVTS
jgi:hypothetical protein